MSGKTYDFRISQSACHRALTAYKNMEIRMSSVEEKIWEHFNLPRLHWKGKFRGVTQAVIIHFLKDGFYFKSLEKVKNMRICLEEALPQINELLARCEGFIDQLQANSYVEPIKPAEDDNTERNGGILSLNYDYISKITEACDSILEENAALTEVLTSIINDCGLLMDGTEEDLIELEKASNKLNRIGNFKKSFSLFARGVQELDVHMMLQLKTIVESERRAIGGMSKEETNLTAAHFTDYDNISAVQKFAEQIFEKDVDEWSEAEIDFIARTWDYAVQNGQKSLIEMYTEEMFTEVYANPDCVIFGERVKRAIWTWDYYLKGDGKKIDLIMSHLDSKTQGTAYYTLNRLKYLQSDCLTISGNSSDLSKCGSYNISAEEVNGEIQIKISAFTGSDSVLWNNSCELGITLCDMNDVIDVDKERKLMSKLYFSKEQIEAMRLSAVTEADIEFLGHLTSGEYAEAFDVHPQGIGPMLIQCLTGYIVHLDDGNKNTELEALINGALTIDPLNNPMKHDTSGQYIKMIRAALVNYIKVEDENILYIEYGSENQISQEKEIDKRAEKLYKLYGLCTAIENVYYYQYDPENRIGLGHQCGPEGILSAKIYGLSDGKNDSEGYYDFKFQLIDYNSTSNEERYALDAQSIIVLTSKVSGEGLADINLRMEIDQLREEREKIKVNAAIDVPAALVNTVIPGTSSIVSVVRFLVDGGYDEFMDAYGNVNEDFPYDEFIKNYNAATGAELGMEELGICLEAYGEIKKIDNQIEEKQQQLEALQLGQGIRITIKAPFILEKDNNQYWVENLCGTDILLPQVVANMRKLEEKGLEVFLEEMGYEGNISTHIDQIKNDISPDEVESKILDGGANILEIPSDDLGRYIDDIQGRLNRNNPRYDLRKWIRGEEQ